MPTPPNVIFSKIFRNLSGYVSNIFLYHAQYFAFKPKFMFTSGGSYIPEERSFSDGKFRKVSTVHGTGKVELITYST